MKKYLLAFSALCLASNAFAAIDCNSTPSCDSLGYTKSQSDCLGQEAIRCPFDISAYYCPDIDSLSSECYSVLFDGKSNTKAMVDELGEDALVAYAATKFYAGAQYGTFGQGNWYLPAIGELMAMSGYDASQITLEGQNAEQCSGAVCGGAAVGDNLSLVEAALSTLKSRGADAEVMSGGVYWSSTEKSYTQVWTLKVSNGNRSLSLKSAGFYVRIFQLLENFKSSFTGVNGLSSPQIGHVVYANNTYGPAANYSGNALPMGVIVYVSKDGTKVKIVNLKDLQFSSKSDARNFIPNKPYGGVSHEVQYTTYEKCYTDITGVENIDTNKFVELIKACPQS